MSAMAKTEHLLGADRTWFYDARTSARRMAVTAHPDEGVVVVSHWQGDQCVSTYRLPIADAGRLISALASGMAGAIPTGGATATPPPPRGWARLADRLRHRRASETKPPRLRALH